MWELVDHIVGDWNQTTFFGQAAFVIVVFLVIVPWIEQSGKKGVM